MKKNDLKSKVTKCYKDHEMSFLLIAGIICGCVGVAIGSLLVTAVIICGAVVGTAIGKKMEHDRLQEILIKNGKHESLIRVDATRALFFFNSLDESMGTVGDLLEGESMTETIRKQPYITDDTEIIGVKYYFKNN